MRFQPDGSKSTISFLSDLGGRLGSGCGEEFDEGLQRRVFRVGSLNTFVTVGAPKCFGLPAAIVLDGSRQFRFQICLHWSAPHERREDTDACHRVHRKRPNYAGQCLLARRTGAGRHSVSKSSMRNFGGYQLTQLRIPALFACQPNVFLGQIEYSCGTTMPPSISDPKSKKSELRMDVAKTRARDANTETRARRSAFAFVEEFVPSSLDWSRSTSEALLTSSLMWGAARSLHCN